MGTQYTYKELGHEEIRILCLSPAIPSEAPLQCNIITFERAKCPAYEAISYAWGKPNDAQGFETLKVVADPNDQVQREGHFLIRQNLAQALKQFRYAKDQRYLWTDAICIDQGSSVEKSLQVPLMENVYSHAEQVLVWLGKADERSRTAFRFMHDMLRPHTNFDDLVKSKHGNRAHEWVALESIMREPWFTRRWIVQEIALARKASLFCGPLEIEWVDFCHVVDLFKLYYSDIKGSFLNEENNYSRNRLGEFQALGACELVRVTNNIFRKSCDGRIQRRLVTLESLVSTLTMFNANFEHDTIYAMIALSKDIRTDAQTHSSVEADASPVQTPMPSTVDDSDDDQPAPKRVKFTLENDQYRPPIERLRQAARKLGHQRTKRPDKLCALVDRAKHAFPGSFPVDYEQTFLKVCIDFVEFAIKRSQSLDIICRPWVPVHIKKKHDLPSWMMDLSTHPFSQAKNGTFRRVNGDLLVGMNPMEPRRYSACGPLIQAQQTTRTKPDEGWSLCCKPHQTHFVHADRPTEHRSLFVSGFVYDTIAHIEEKAVDGTIPDSWFEFADWRNRASPPPDDLWRTLVADRESDGSSIGAFYSRTLRDIVQEHCTCDGGSLNVKEILATPLRDRRSEKVLSRILAVVTNRRLFRTTFKKGRLMGLAPAKARASDLICILFGCSVPVILRRHELVVDGNNLYYYYELIGECYIHGLMEGHALDELEVSTGTSRYQTFELR